MAERALLGGLTRRPRPAVGIRPTLLFSGALALTIAYVATAVWVSRSWRSDLELAIGPVAGWVIPIFLAYIPGFVIGFMVFTLALSRYRPAEAVKDWPAVTVVVAARNEEAGIVRTLERMAALDYPGEIKVVLADNGSTDETAARAEDAATRLGLDYLRVEEAEPGKHRALNTALDHVTTALVVTVDADTLLQREAKP